MSGEVVALVAAALTAVGAIGGTVWTQRRRGPDMTETVLGSVGAHVTRLDAEVQRVSDELEQMRRANERLQHQVDELSRALRAEKSYTSVLVSKLVGSGVQVPAHPGRDHPFSHEGE